MTVRCAHDNHGQLFGHGLPCTSFIDLAQPLNLSRESLSLSGPDARPGPARMSGTDGPPVGERRRCTIPGLDHPPRVEITGGASPTLSPDGAYAGGNTSHACQVDLITNIPRGGVCGTSQVTGMLKVQARSPDPCRDQIALVHCTAMSRQAGNHARIVCNFDGILRRIVADAEVNPSRNVDDQTATRARAASHIGPAPTSRGIGGAGGPRSFPHRR
ncbi:hypothetical protein MRB53_038176 [Persea americana]|nr:hypothetical protein MRB53_038176 [Persea americana]